MELCYESILMGCIKMTCNMNGLLSINLKEWALSHISRIYSSSYLWIRQVVWLSQSSIQFAVPSLNFSPFQIHFSPMSSLLINNTIMHPDIKPEIRHCLQPFLSSQLILDPLTLVFKKSQVFPSTSLQL